MILKIDVNTNSPTAAGRQVENDVYFQFVDEKTDGQSVLWAECAKCRDRSGSIIRAIK
jgi:hypothetical protein